jgi:hypothetical protein
LFNARLSAHVDRLRTSILAVRQPLLLTVDDDEDELIEGGINDGLPSDKRASSNIIVDVNGDLPLSPKAAALVNAASLAYDQRHHLRPRERAVPMSPISSRHEEHHHAHGHVTPHGLAIQLSPNASVANLIAESKKAADSPAAAVPAVNTSTTLPTSPTPTAKTSLINNAATADSTSNGVELAITIPPSSKETAAEPPSPSLHVNTTAAVTLSHRTSSGVLSGDTPIDPESALAHNTNAHERLLRDLLQFIANDTSNLFRIFGLELNLGLVARITLVVGGAFATGIGNFVLSQVTK